MNTFNDSDFIKEFKEFIDNLNVKSLLEIGCQSDELRNAMPEGIQTLGIDVDIQEYKSRKKFDLVFSSGLLQKLPDDKAVETIEKMATLSKQYVLNYVPNSNCIAYKNYKSNTDDEWKNEKDFNTDELIELHKKAGLEILQSGVVAKEWAKRFGNEESDGYLVYVLAKKLD